MDAATIIFKAVELLPRFLPRAKPPVTDYGPLYAAIPQAPEIRAVEVTIQPQPRPVQPVSALPVAAEEPEEERQQTGCMSCSRSHLSTVSGALNESLRFARESGVGHPEVQKRLMLAEDEINIMERIDLSAQALEESPQEERELAQEYLPRIRALRQDIGAVTSTDALQRAAADASVLGQEFRLRHLQLKGIDLNPVLDLARRVQSGEISMEDAKAKLREILPEEE